MALVCSVNTLLMNGNPLLKFDGYYVLADWWEIPNLQHAAKSQLRYAVEWWVLRDRPLPSYLAPERSQFALTIYALASVIYRVMLLAIILAFIYGALAARGVAIVGAAIVALVLFTAVGRPASTLVRQLAEPGYRARMHWPKVAGTAIFSLIIVLLVLFVPMRQHVIVPVTFQARGAEPVYVSVAGTLMEASQEGTAIEPDAVLARLEDLELEWQIARLQLQRDEQQLHVEQLERAQSVDDTAAEQLSAARSACDDLNERLSRRQQDQQQLVIRAVRRGVVIPPNISLRPDSSDELPTWDGTPLDPRNRGGLLPSGTLLCWIGDPSQQEVIANLEQSQVDRVRAGQRVRLRCDQLPGKILHGVVQDVSQREIQTEKPAMTSADSLSHAQGGEPYGEATRFEARIVLDAPQHQIRLGARGQAKILVSPESWARRLGAW
jgi:putative peptide zinc metalloprotease protein